MPEHGAYEQHMPTIVDSGSAELYGDLNFYNQPRLPPLPSNFPQLSKYPHIKLFLVHAWHTTNFGVSIPRPKSYLKGLISGLILGFSACIFFRNKMLKILR